MARTSKSATIRVIAHEQAEWSKEKIQERFERIISLMDDAKREIRGYMGREEEGEKFVDMASWSMNAVENMMRNINAATLMKDIARYQAGIELRNYIDETTAGQEAK